jgi:hypothetical protein
VNKEVGVNITLPTSYVAALDAFASEIATRFKLQSVAQAQPEEQLKGPVADLIKAVGPTLGLSVQALPEVRVDEIGRLVSYSRRC